MSKPRKISPVKAKNIGRGDAIKDGKHSGRVTDHWYHDFDEVAITWERGSASGLFSRHPDENVRRVYKPKSRRAQ